MANNSETSDYCKTPVSCFAFVFLKVFEPKRAAPLPDVLQKICCTFIWTKYKKQQYITQVREYRATLKASPARTRGGDIGSQDSPIRTATLSPLTPVTYASVAT